MSRPPSQSPSALSSPSLPDIKILENETSPPRPYVLVPRIRETRKALYASSMAEAAARDEAAIALLDKIDEVVGYVEDNGVGFYYGRRQDGIIRRWERRHFQDRHEHLIDTFERKKDTGEFAWFDPSSTSLVHPKSRMRLSIHIRPTPSAKSDIGDSEAGFSEAQDELDEDESDDEAADDEEYDEEDVHALQTRRSTRTAANKPRDLPFSPRKTRSQKIYTIDDSDESEGDDAGGSPVQTRRSTRSKRPLKLNLDTDYAESDAEDSDEYTTAKRPKGKPKPRRAKAAPPAYGFIRPIADIDLDPLSDEETVQLRKHRMSCEKCHMPPAHQEIERLQKKKRKGGRRKKKNQDEFEDSDDEVERESKKGGWVRCLKCAVSAHFGCLASAQRDEILKAAKARDIAAWREQNPDGDPKEEPAKRKALQVDETTDFVCGGCMKGGICMSCEKVALLPGGRLPTEKPPTADIEMADPSGDVEMTDGTAKNGVDGPVRELLFRCLTCKRMAHYEHLPPPNGDSDTPSEIAAYYQRDTRWLCDDCNSCVGESLDKILAWKPYPANAAQPPDPVHYKDNLPREYLVKWDNRSYRRVQWVPHMWLVSTSPQKLKHFLAVGAKVDLLDEATARKKAAAEAEDSGHLSDVEETPEPNGSLPLQTKDGLVDAEARIPKEWTTVDRVLDFILWNPNKPAKVKGKKGKGGKNKRKQRIESDDEDEMDEELIQIREDIFKNGTTPAEAVTETLEEWEARMRRKFTVDDIDDVVWAFIKWQELGYEEATWDAPPREGEPGYADFKRALERNLIGRTVTVPRKMPQRIEDRPKKGFEPYHLEDASELKIGQDPALKLMPFQVDGFNWLCDNWWNHQPCILADEMGLGKTVQVSSFVGNIIDKWQAFPALVVVPNSTLTNWVREFERWAPKLRVVPYYGEAKARQVIQRYELSHPKTPPNCTDAKFHVLVTSYEAVTHKTDFGAVFKKQPRWEVLIIDEGQRLKNDKSLLFQKLNDLKAKHRVIMTGTPLNNNIRELFNLMNFLEPEKWADLEALEAEYEELTEDLVKQLHDRLRPYFLRRIKSEVLQLPPKNEVIVPVSMSPIQKELYRSILSKNVDILNGLRSGAGNTKSQGTNNVKNILMQLRKCLQHPYLYDGEIEPKGLAPQEAHDKLIDASAKLRLLKSLLPKLKARGHRVLIFSQFVINLNIVEDFLAGERYRFLRLDGNTKGPDRQKAMDEFNRADSDVFVFMLTTRAGGVGINLYSADTVIIYDPDFNPHQDLQAIARAHRFGQQKTCLVFKLMVKDSAEERIIQVGKKKLVLDHLIVQKINDNDEDAENVQSILTYGAQALFEESAEQAEARNISYSDHDLDKLIERTEREGDEEDVPKGGGLSFEFAKIWSADKDDMVEVNDTEEQGDSWAQALEKINAEREKAREAEVEHGGRGARRAAAMNKPTYYVEDTPVKPKGKGKAIDASSSYGSDIDEDATVSDTETGVSAVGTPGPSDPDKPAKEVKTRKRKRSNFDGSAEQSKKMAVDDDEETCGLCNQIHGDGQCALEQSPENMFELREMLMSKDLDTDEPVEDRMYAITLLEERIHKMNLGHKLVGQPLHYVPPRPVAPPAQPQPQSVSTPGLPVKRPRGRPKKEPNAVAGPSKRPSSPTAPAPPAKKAKVSVEEGLCDLCKPTGAHTYGNCPVIAEGPKRISKEIQRLVDLPGTTSTVNNLRSMLKKLKKAEIAKATAQGTVIEL